jgi:hypothetical protein
VTINKLAANTAYYFDLQVTDSSGATWVYSNPTMAVMEMPSTPNLPPNAIFQSSATSCTIGSVTVEMAAITSYTTTSSGTGNAYVSLAFNVASPSGTAGLTSKWQLAWGTTAVPACAAIVPGGTTVVGKQYTVETVTATAGIIVSEGQSEGIVVNGLPHGTQVWFAVEVTDSTAASWVYSNAALSVVEIMPADFVHSNTVFSSNANTCTRNTAATLMAGLATSYTTTSFGTGNIQATLTFGLTSPIDGSTSTYTLTYGTGAAPGCNGALTGTTLGNSFSNIYTSGGQTKGFSLVGLTPGTKYWFDVRALDSTVANWVYNNPEISVVELP